MKPVRIIQSATSFPMPALVYRRGMHEGYHWVVTKNPEMATYNGYVCVPEDHPWMDLDYNQGYSPPNNVPFGEITFREGRWFGFDTMHTGQWWPDVIAKYEAMGINTDIWKRNLFGGPSVEMTVDHVLLWVLQLCVDARDAYNEKE